MSVQNVELRLILLIFFVGVLALLARRLQTLYPIVLIMAREMILEVALTGLKEMRPSQSQEGKKVSAGT